MPQQQTNGALHAWGAVLGVLLVVGLIIGAVNLSRDDQTNGLSQADLKNALDQLDVNVSIDQSPEFQELCENLDGCDGYRIDLSDKFDAVDRVRGLLEEDDNRDLHKFLEDFHDIDENEDVEDVSLHRLGKIRASEEFDSFFDLSDTLEINVEYAVKVVFHENGGEDETTKYFRVTATLYDLEDGFDDGEIKNVNVEPIAKDEALTSN